MRAWLLVGLLALGCDAPREVAPEVDAASQAGSDAGAGSGAGDGSDAGAGGDGVADAAPATERVEIGTGPEAFEPVAAGQVLTLHRGCQGAQHVWLSLWLPDWPAGVYGVRAVLQDAGGGALTPTLRLADEPWRAAAAGGAELVGLTLVVFDPPAVMAGEVWLEVTVLLPEGRRAAARLPVAVVWGADAC